MANARFIVTIHDDEDGNVYRTCEDHVGTAINELYKQYPGWREMATHQLNATAGFTCDFEHEDPQLAQAYAWDWINEDIMAMVMLPIDSMVSPRILVQDVGMRWAGVLSVDQGVIGDTSNYASINGDQVEDVDLQMRVFDIFEWVLGDYKGMGPIAPDEKGWVTIPNVMYGTDNQNYTAKGGDPS